MELNEASTTSIREAMRATRQRAVVLVGQVERNQGRPTFTGRLTLDQFAELTVVHNRRWAEAAGESLQDVTQREIIDGRANDLAVFMLQGLADATIRRLKDEESLDSALIDSLEKIQDRVGRSAHYGLPQVTLVLPKEPEVGLVRERESEEIVAARLSLPSGMLFVVADGQHRREAARKVREFLNDLIANRRVPQRTKLFTYSEGALLAEDMDAWIAMHETFRIWTMVSFEAHIGLSVNQARQMFTNYNCHVKPVKMDLNLEFDQNNPINKFQRNGCSRRSRPTRTEESRSG